MAVDKPDFSSGFRQEWDFEAPDEIRITIIPPGPPLDGGPRSSRANPGNHILSSSDPVAKPDAEWSSAVRTATLSDTGMRRRNNQDSWAVVIADNQGVWEKSGHLFVVADGMGAHAAGELASRLAADLIPHQYSKLQKLVPAEALMRAISETNSEIYRRGQANPEFRNMGTTASVLALVPEGAVVAHVGDSRIYRLRGQQLEQLTFDHSLVWEMAASGEVNEETLRSGVIPKNVITRSLGPNPSVQIDLEGPFPLKIGDRFLLCSDGLSGQVTDEEIGILLHINEPQVAAQVMVDLANLRGGPDNITVVIAEITGKSIETIGSEPTPAVDPSTSIFDGFSPALGLVAGICLLASIVLFIVGQWPLAVVAFALSIITLITGLVQRKTRERIVESTGDRYGRGPHRRFPVKSEQGFVDQLAGTINALREAASENQWTIHWDEINPTLERGKSAERSKDLASAIRAYSEVLIGLMKQVKENRNRQGPSDSSIHL